MIAYLDTSALLRLVLREPGAFEEVLACEAMVSSELLAVESLRTLDRLRIQGALSVEEAAARRQTVAEWLEAVDLVLLQRPILARALGAVPDVPRHPRRAAPGDGAGMARSHAAGAGDGHARPRPGSCRTSFGLDVRGA